MSLVSHCSSSSFWWGWWTAALWCSGGETHRWMMPCSSVRKMWWRCWRSTSAFTHIHSGLRRSVHRPTENPHWTPRNWGTWRLWRALCDRWRCWGWTVGTGQPLLSSEERSVQFSELILSGVWPELRERWRLYTHVGIQVYIYKNVSA